MTAVYRKLHTLGATADILLSSLESVPQNGAELIQWELRATGTAEFRPIFGAETTHAQIALTNDTNIASLSGVTDWRLTSTAGAAITLVAHKG